ncbi:Sec-independent protein translocase subunit TatA/TatB [Natronogracilivirga saccharolytica]|uniref:Sec-independent protein translocase protein TatA n=1 Tax=Natronogracilivirga saccharolytica TaxID=2812953 RepID=A0A8J7UVZ3_9BACT|nr:twin-arginine translocase TatA/TatE family subunit [Natronogracilivirga saccharolytica]MBP3193082.1 twin-arginine translocase TatA/TatE family subunit [Natronogracilivirga saccharolytica]
MGSFGGIEWLVIILVVLLLFGAKKIPELARGLGQGLTEFRKASSDIRKEIEKGSQEPTAQERAEKKQEQQESTKKEKQPASDEKPES